MAPSSILTRLRSFLRELKRRKVYRAGAVYVVVGFAVAQGAEYLFQILGLPEVAARIVAVVLLLGLPVVLVLAWAYELRPEEDPTASEGVTEQPAVAQMPKTNPGPSIVVLPFDNISPDPSDAYFADGLTEEITASLCGVRDLRVTSRNSATAAKSAGKGTRSIAAELGVAYVLEGSVRKAGDALRVTAQLIRTETDEHLWSERYDGALSDVFGMQEEVARSIVRTLELHLRPEEDRRLAARPMDDVVAYESYLKAREASLRWTFDALEYALAHLKEAHARVGDNAVVLAGIGYVYSQFSNMGANDRDYVALAEEHARRALELDPDNPEAHMVLGFLYQEGLGDIDRSLRHLERSLAVKPDDPHTLTWWIIALSLVGRNEEMQAAAERLLQVDPLTPRSVLLRGYARQIRGDLEGALEDMERGYRESPRGSAASYFYAHALATVGHREEALTTLRTDFAPDAESVFISVAVLMRAALEGEPRGMEAVMTDDFRAKISRDLQLMFQTSSIYALGGRREQARNWLRSVIDGGFRNYPWLTNDPWLCPYGDDPDFQGLFEEVREEWERHGGGR